MRKRGRQGEALLDHQISEKAEEKRQEMLKTQELVMCQMEKQTKTLLKGKMLKFR